MDDKILELTVDIVSAYVSRNSIPPAELTTLVLGVYKAMNRLPDTEPTQGEKQQPAVNPKRSVHDNHIICLEDGKEFKSLKRHLMSHHELTPERYRAKWGLPPDYPMVAPHYATLRSALAKAAGLGRKAAPKPSANTAGQRSNQRKSKTAGERPSAKSKAK